MSHRHICVHGHFYQPPRENPWLGEVAREDSAAPFHDWNDRIAEECYGPMVLGMRAGSDGSVIAYESILRRLSFNFGPTLLDWLERRRPSIHDGILAADKASCAQDGLGSAIAQPYYHVILPLAGRRDKETLVRWGLADFQSRFGRKAKGMWLPETAVDDDTLDVLAAEGLEFTILSPTQAAAVRSAGGSDWTAVSAETLDPKTPYLWVSPTDASRRLAVFFFHRRLSDGVVSGETVADASGFCQGVLNRLMPGDAAQMVHVASDGEFYGHHNPGAERVLSLALDLLADEGVTPINHSRFLKLFPPPREVRIRPNTAWSCEHGLGRWTRDCGCRSKHLPDWSQDWRGPLRDALDRLAHRLDTFYEDEAGRFFTDPWAVRDDSAVPFRYRGSEHAARFLTAHAKRPLTEEEEGRALRLLAMQRERLAMFTSCAWFFDDISGIETIQVLERAGRALDLARGLGEDAEGAFVERLAAAKSNWKEYTNGTDVWRRLAAPSLVDLPRLAASAAILDHLEMASRAFEAASVELGPAFRVEKAGLAGRDRTLSVRLARAARPATRELGEWHAIVHRGDRLDFACWLAPREAGPLDPAEIGRLLLGLDDDSFRAAMDLRFGTSRFGLDAVLGEERAELSRALAPEGGLGPERSSFLRGWTAAIMAVRRGGTDDDALLHLLGGAKDMGLLPEELPWARELEEVLHSRLEAVATGAGGALLSRALRWLDALWDAGLLSGHWRLRDFHARWSARLAAAGPSAEKDACRALGERLGLAECLLEGSR